MAYVGKTNWVDGEVVKDVDLNRIEQGITGVDTGKEALVKNASTKATPVDADSLVLVDSAFSGTTKRVLWSSIKTTLKTWLDTLYSAVGHTHAWSAITGKPTSFAPTAHKDSHKTGGTDALSPGDIGAATASHTHAPSDLSAAVPISKGGTGATTAAQALAALGAAAAGDLAAKRPNIIRTLPIAAGNTVSAGDVVDVVGGEVQKSYSANPNIKSVFSSNAITYTGVTKLNNAYSVVLYARGTVGGGRVLNNLTGEALPNEPQFTVGTPSYISCARLNDTKFVAEYVENNSPMYARIGTLSGADVTYGATLVVSATTTTYNTVIPLSETSFISIYNRSGLKAKVCTVSGTTITAGTEYSLSGSTSSAYISATRLPDSGSNRRVCVCYSDAGDSNKGKAVIATINASNVVSWGTPVVFESTYVSSISCCADGDDVVVVHDVNNMTSGSARVMTVSDSSITINLPLNISGSAFTYPQIVKQGIGFTVTFNRAGGYAIVLVRTGTTLSKGIDFKFNNGTSAYLSAVAVSDSQLIATFADGGNSSYGTATLLTIRGNQIAGSFTDVSSQAIALQSGTAGQSIDIIFDGVAELSSITAGTKITSSGVQGYAPQNGWLWVRPSWEQHYGTKLVTGSYVGTGGFGIGSENTLNFDFTPDVVVVSHKDNAHGGFNWVQGCTVGGSRIVSGTLDTVTIMWNQSSVKWSGSNSGVQLNIAGTIYKYFAMGKGG